MAVPSGDAGRPSEQRHVYPLGGTERRIPDVGSGRGRPSLGQAEEPLQHELRQDGTRSALLLRQTHPYQGAGEEIHLPFQHQRLAENWKKSFGIRKQCAVSLRASHWTPRTDLALVSWSDVTPWNAYVPRACAPVAELSSVARAR